MKIIFKFVFSAVTLCWALNAQAALITFFGEDRGLNIVTSHRNSDAAQTSFFAMTTGRVNESFEGFNKGDLADGLDVFDSATATQVAKLSGEGEVDNASNINTHGRFPIGGSNYLKTHIKKDTNWSGGTPIKITFNDPVAAFGLYLIDVGDKGGTLTIQLSDGSTDSVSLNTLRTDAGLTTDGINRTVAYVGLYDAGGTMFNAIELQNGNPELDRFTYDDMTAATSVVPLPPSVLLLFSGLTGLAMLGRRKARQV